MILHRDVANSRVDIEIPLFPRMPEHLFYYKQRSFVDAVKSGSTSPIPSSEIIINQAISDGIVKSSELGREIEVEIPEI